MKDFVKIEDQEIISYLCSMEIDFQLIGKFDSHISGFCSAGHPRDGCIMWVREVRRDVAGLLGKCRECIIVAPQAFEGFGDGCRLIVVQSPRMVFFKILEHFWKQEKEEGTACSCVIETDDIGRGFAAGHHCAIGKNVSIGNNVHIENNVSIRNKVKIGNGCVIHSGTVIGTDGFGYNINSDGIPEKISHYGGVVIGNNVEIGANSCIDRGTIDDTVIGNNVKIDNLCHIAHNAVIGDNAMVIAGAIICGSAELAQGAYIAPGGIVKNQTRMGKNSFAGLGAVVVKPVRDNMLAAGVPAKEIRKVRKDDK